MFDFITKEIYGHIKPYKTKAIGAVLLSFVIAGVGGLQVKLIKPLFDHGLSAESTFNEVLILSATLLILGLIHFPSRFFHFYWLRFIVDRATCSVRSQLMEKLLKLPMSYYQKNKGGQLMSYVLNDSIVYSQGFKASIDLIREPMKAVVYLGMAFYNDWQLTAVIFAIAPFLILIFSFSGKAVKKNQGEVQQEHGVLTHNISEALASNKVTKAFNLQNFVVKRFNLSQNNFFNAQMRTTKIEELAHPLVEIVGTCAFCAVIIFAHYRIRSGATTIGEFIAFVAALALFMDPIRKFSQANVKLSQAKAASERINSVLQMEEEKDLGSEVLDYFKHSIEVKNLTFSYGEGDVIRDLNLIIKKGEKVALVGLSGSGKSTLINLLLGLYPIESGDILIDGKPIQDIKLKSLRKLFGLVSQDIFLFHDSIKDNLTLGEDIEDIEVSKALQIAFATEFVEKLPQREDTLVGDRGTRLSGGQQQRITIARAFLQNNDILLFDEATSALDNESEKIVQKAMEKVAGDKTVVAVAHRLSTIQDFDKIYVMSEGQVVEQGKHAELIAAKKDYFKLYSLSTNS